MDTFRTSRPVSAPDAAQPHIILVGLPGSGKSAVGGVLAGALGRRFLDFDLEISRREGMEISDIFAQRGEQHFRDLEHGLTEELRELGSMVLAPGGGWMMRPDTVALLRPPAMLVYLRVTPATAVRRMGRGISSRPLLRHSDPAGELGRILERRRAAYETADVLMDVEGVAPQQVAERVLQALGLPDRGRDEVFRRSRLTTPLP